MGWFNKKSESYEAGDLVAALENASSSKDRAKILDDIKNGKFVYSASDLKKMEKEVKRMTEGEKTLKALRAALKGGGTGNRNYFNVPVSARVHPSRLRDLEKSGKLGIPGISAAQALRIKETDPKKYQMILEAEARRQGLK